MSTDTPRDPLPPPRTHAPLSPYRLTGIAAPIFGSGGLVGGVVLGVPTERFKLNSERLIAHTVAAAREISQVQGQISQTQSV